MKVIGVTGEDYLVQIHSDELEKLTGGVCGWGDGDLRNVGKKLEIRKPWDTIRELQCHQKDLPQIANKLRALADLLEPIAIEVPVVN